MAEITVNIKCSNADKATITVERSATVADVKEKIGETLSVPASQQRLIYKGRVLKDDLTVEHYDIQDGHTVHMVKGAAPVNATNVMNTTNSAATSVNTPPSSANSVAFGAPNVPNLFGPMNSVGAPAGGQDINRMQEQLLRNPEMMQQIMNSPMMDHMMNNPDLMRNMMGNNPQMQALMDSNPQIRHMMNDPAMLRQSMEMMRNPNAMAAAMRSQDLAMSQIENLPGGFNALQRMFEEVQEPLMEASQQQAAATQRTNISNTPSVPAPAQTAPNNAALPNPWGAPAAGGMADMGAFNSPFAAMGGGGNPFGMGGAQDPAAMAAMMQNPAMQQMMAQMMQDPNMIQQMAAMNPQLGAALQNPQVRAMMANPDFLRQMSDPQTMQAMMRMQQQGMGGMGGMGGGGFGGNPYAALMNQNPYGGGGGGMAVGGNPFAAAGPYGAGGPAAGGGLNFSSLFNSGGGHPAFSQQPAAAPVDPAVRYAAQLQQLQDMGFSDAGANLRALQATGGGLNAAVERLLGGGL